MSKKLKLNIGSGPVKIKGFINVDYYNDADVKHDLDTYPYPFNENSVDAIEARMVMEHIDDTVSFLKELYSISTNGAHIHIVVPFANSYYLWTDITHKRGFTPESFTQFIDYRGSDAYYVTPAKFKVTKITLIPTATGKLFLRPLRNFLSKYLVHIVKDIDVEMVVIK